MLVLKSGKNIFGAKLTAAEKKALDMEARRSLAEYTRKHELEIESTVLWQIKQLTDWDEGLLKAFYQDFDITLDKLIEYYEMGSEDAEWLCMRKLKDEGIDLEAWRREKYPNLKYDINCK
jgi:hypothetical protein